MRPLTLETLRGKTLCSFFVVCQLLTSWAASQTQTIHRSSIRFLNPPELLTHGHVLQVLYHCEEVQVVNVWVLASSPTKSLVGIYKKKWICSPGPSVKKREIKLDFPDQLVYREDYFIHHPIDVLDVLLRAWISEYFHPGSGMQGNSYSRAIARTYHFLEPLPLYSRPYKQHQKTLRWDQEVIWRIKKDKIPQCEAEQEAVHLLKFLYACTGESFGVLRAVEPYRDHVLEGKRRKSVFSPHTSFSTWLYLVEWCPVRFCGVLYHLDDNHEYSSPSILLTNTGYLHVQFLLVSGEAHAVQSLLPVPVNVWCQIQLTLDGSKANLNMICEDMESKMGYSLPTEVLVDDTIGHFHLCGSQYVQGVSGFYGPSLYHRNRITPIYKAPPPKLLEDMDLSHWHQSCHHFQQDCISQFQWFLSRLRSDQGPESCSDVYTEYVTQYRLLSPAPGCSDQETPPTPRRAAVTRLLRKVAGKTGRGSLDAGKLGKALYSRYVRKVSTPEGLSRIRGYMPLLLQAGCLGYQPALFLAAALYQTGFGVRKDQAMALKLNLLSAQKDERLSQMSLGHKHHMGADNYPLDYDLSYAYYSNIAFQTITDRVEPGKEQAFVEFIRLVDEDILKHQTKEDDDLFMWLRYQAKQGVSSAQQAVGRMLFWGQQGISSNIQAAVKYYEKGAQQQKDPVMMYDYGVVLLRGQGVDQDIPKALKYLKKAADMDFVPAINSLGWYYETFERDYKTAVEYWERADKLGNAEAPFNLGIMYYQGLYPGQGRNHSAAYRYYLKSALRGHIDAAVHLSAVWIQGIPGVVERLPYDAVVWTKWVAEQNGHLGVLLRKALDAYLHTSWPGAIIHYIQAAEAGVEIAHFNAAYLCEQDPRGLVSRHVQIDCAWKYYNLSTHSERPPSYAQIKMGDFYYGDRLRKRRNVQAAVEMYKKAALQEDPQGLYNLGLLVEEGVSLPHSTLRELGFNTSMYANNYTIIMELYRRCRDHEKEDSYVPCSLALLQTQLQYVWTVHGPLLKCSSAAAVAIVTALSLMTIIARLQNGALNLYHSV
uniref:Protein sel-1 homolog 3-like n=1 Tax=Leptobrachium leishanense TaxID=445787 RepID=A0A8C5MCY0_9ANUR